jgi:hypothetical protein
MLHVRSNPEAQAGSIYTMKCLVKLHSGPVLAIELQMSPVSQICEEEHIHGMLVPLVTDRAGWRDLIPTPSTALHTYSSHL